MLHVTRGCVTRVSHDYVNFYLNIQRAESLKDLLKIKYFLMISVKSSINIDVTNGGVPGGDGAGEYG